MNEDELIEENLLEAHSKAKSLVAVLLGKREKLSIADTEKVAVLAGCTLTKIGRVYLLNTPDDRQIKMSLKEIFDYCLGSIL